MERFKKLLKKLFCLPPLPTVLIAVPSFVFVFFMLSVGDHGVLAYVSYCLSAYAMIITVTGVGKVIRAVRHGIEELPLVKKIRANPIGGRFLSDAGFRSAISLGSGLLANLLYVALNMFSGIRYRLAWFVTLAFYYVFLSAMRVLLLTQLHRTAVGRDVRAEYRRCRIFGIILLMMNQVLVGIVIYIVTENRGFEYPGLMIYAMALYTFYITVTAIINVIRFRKHGSPVLTASKVINLTAALVSMLSLETAMIARFGGTAEFRRTMTAASGGGVCVIVLGMAVYMIAHSAGKLKRLNALADSHGEMSRGDV